MANLNTTITYHVEHEDGKPFCDCELRYYDMGRDDVAIVESALVNGFMGTLNRMSLEKYSK